MQPLIKAVWVKMHCVGKSALFDAFLRNFLPSVLDDVLCLSQQQMEQQQQRSRGQEVSTPDVALQSQLIQHR